MDAGSLLSHEQVDTAIAGARAWRVRYASRDLNGVAHECTGLVIAPAGPGSDRPILTWCHGTTGLGDAGCPSAQPDPARELAIYFSPEATRQIDYGVPGLQQFIDDGWVVCATDYQGLGSPGMHQYMVNPTNARDALNIAHAARALETGAGTRLGCVGWSQGGGAAAAIDELEPADYGDLELIGTVPMSLAIPSIAMSAPAGPADGSAPPDSHLVMLLCGLQAANPSVLNLTDVFTPLGVEIIEAAWNTQPAHHLTDTIARLFRLKGPILTEKPTNPEAWKAAAAAASAALDRKPAAPVMVCVDSFKGGTVVPVAWQTAYVDAVRAAGGTVEVRDYPDDDHSSLPQSCVADVRAWLTGLL